MRKPKTKGLARRGTETTAQRVKMQMRETAGRDVSPESYGGDTIEDSAQYIAERTTDGIREMGSSVKDKAMEQVKERIERVRQREDRPNAQEPDSGQSSPQEPQSGRSYSEPRTDSHTGPQEQTVDANPDPAPDRLPRQRPECAERIKTKDSYIHSQGEASAPKEIRKGHIQTDPSVTPVKEKAVKVPAKAPDAPKTSNYISHPRQMERTAFNTAQAEKRTVKTAEKYAVKTMQTGLQKLCKSVWPMHRVLLLRQQRKA